MTNPTNKRQTLEQKRAAAAWEAVQNAKQVGKDFEPKFKTLATGLAANLQANGLGQTLSFLLAKSKEKDDSKSKNIKEHKCLYDACAAWIKSSGITQEDNLMKWIIKQASTEDYRRATSEAMAFAIWLKRFAEAELAETKSQEERVNG